MPAEDSSDGGGGTSVGMVPNQLAMLVPTFNPATDSVDTWTQKVEMLVLSLAREQDTGACNKACVGLSGNGLPKATTA